MKKIKTLDAIHIYLNSGIILWLFATIEITGIVNLRPFEINPLPILVIFTALISMTVLLFQNKIISILAFLFNISLLIFVIVEESVIDSALTLLNYYEMPSTLPDSLHWNVVLSGLLLTTIVIWNFVFIIKNKLPHPHET